MTQQTTPILEQLKSALASHDWYYNYSDDYSVYSRGQRKWSNICSLRQQAAQAGLQAEADALYDRYAK